MSLPTPRPGLVIRYSFLWSHERNAGLYEGTKDRPCAIVVAAPVGEDGEIHTIVAPITHSPPDDGDRALEVPAVVCRQLGLDDAPHWLRFDELNRFLWPGFDLRPNRNGRYDYGMLPKGLFEALKQAILERQRTHAPRIISRDDET